jgi:serine/threonine-protein kinase
MQRIYQSGHKVDQYRIIQLLALKEDAQFYLAQDWQAYRQVVLKFPLDGAIGGRAIFERFQQEAKIGRTLDHPSFQRTLAFVNNEQGYYLVLEALSGKTLREILVERTPDLLPVSEVLSTILQVCAALASLHEQGVLHGNIKPEHIILLETGHIKITDLGLAQRVKSHTLWFPRFFPTGTPDYLPPERWWGCTGSVQSDIYAVGILLYELLCGHPPFGRMITYSLLVPQLAFDPPDIYQACHDLKPQLATMVMRAIRREPRKRYARMQELLTDLKHLDQITPVPYLPDPPLIGGKYRLLLFLFLLTLIVIGALIVCGMTAQLVYAELS